MRKVDLLLKAMIGAYLVSLNFLSLIPALVISIVVLGVLLNVVFILRYYRKTEVTDLWIMPMSLIISYALSFFLSDSVSLDIAYLGLLFLGLIVSGSLFLNLVSENVGMILAALLIGAVSGLIAVSHQFFFVVAPLADTLWFLSTKGEEVHGSIGSAGILLLFYYVLLPHYLMIYIVPLTFLRALCKEKSSLALIILGDYAGRTALGWWTGYGI